MTGSAAYPWRRRGLAAVGAIALLLAGGLGANLWLDHRNSARAAEQAAGAWAAAMADQAATLLDSLDRLMQGLQLLPAEPGAASAEMERRERAGPAGAVLALATADGQLRLLTPQAARYLAAPDLAPLAATIAGLSPVPELVLAPLLRSTVGPLLPLLRRLPGGQVAMALLPLRLVEATYARIGLPPGSGLALLDRQGRLLASLPPRPEALGLPLPGLPEAARVAGPLAWRGALLLPAGPAYAVAAALPGLPAIQLATQQEAAALAPWIRRARWAVLLTGLSLLAIGAGAWLLLREAGRRLASQAAASRRLEELAQASAEIGLQGELPDMLQRIARLARRAGGAGFATLALQDGLPRRPVLDLAPGAALPEAERARLQVLAATPALAAGPAPLLLPGDAAAGRLPALALPLQDAEGAPLGLLLLAGPDGGADGGGAAFSADDIATLQPLARLAEIALRNRGLIGALRAAVEEAESGRARVEAVLESLDDGFLALDLDWRITYANGAARRLLGDAARPLQAEVLWQRLPDLAAGCALTRLHRVAARAERADFEAGLPALDRRFRLIAHPAGDGVALYLRPLAEAPTPPSRRLQQRRLALAGRMAGRLGADVRGLLAQVATQAETLEAALRDRAPGLAGLARQILAASQRGTAQWNRLQDMARPYPRPPQPTDLAARLRDFLPVLRRALGPELTLTLAAPEGLPRPMLAPAALEDALLGMLGHLAELLPPGGRLALSLDEGRLPLPVGGDPGHARPVQALALRLEGRGPPGWRAPAGPVEPLSEDSLAAIAGFARRQGGLLRAEPVPPQGPVGGWRLALLLPVAPPAPPRAPLAAHVLLVEDEAPLRARMAGQLHELGYAVTAVADGPAALGAVAEGTRPDLLLTDVVLPGGLSGVRLAAELRARQPGLPVLLVSAFTPQPEALAAEALAAEALPLLAKPVGTAELGLRLAALLAPPAAA
ncbi:response regulator [Roseomonas sp. 18066]|uniref:response regulator n=1 Tax=Roseomonas sp. 18066 TaxID=2681412 RepID=UPI00135CEF0D|nr:response regulator [Roseomonas sp. 18066]